MKCRQLVSSVGIAAVVVGVSACDNPNSTTPLISDVADTPQVFALTGTPPS
jgi:hypothetical protein